MKKRLLIIFCMLGCMLFSMKTSQACSVAGTVVANRDSICYEDTVVVSTSGYTGTVFQWQSNDGSGWVNETGSGATTDTYSVVAGATKQYRVLVTQTACPTDTSNAVTVHVGDIPVPTGIGGSRCGYGQVALTGTGAAGGNLRWFTSPTGGTSLGQGSPFNVTVASTTTFYLEDNTYSGSGGASPLQITEFDINDYPSGGTGDDIEVQNVSSLPLDVTGWKIALSNSYTDINNVNPIVQTLNGVIPPGGTIWFTDAAAGPNYWGNNILWNSGAFPTFTGWAMILDNNNVLRDFVALNWPAANIQAMAPVVNGVTITIGSQWTGDGVNITTVVSPQGVVRVGNADNNDNADFLIDILSIGSTNPGLNIPLQGFGCSSSRIPVVATVNPSTPITLNATANALCLGQSSTLSVSSSNNNYSYTWFPSTGLSGTTGTSVTATPLVPTTYYVTGVDGNCGAIDSLFINVGPTSVAGTATVTSNTLCAGSNTTLTLAGSTGTIQWQSNTGSSWVNETGTGSNSTLYQIAPTVTADYRAFVTSGGCPSDSSNIINVNVIPVSTPTTLNDTICAGGLANLNATGSGSLNWFTAPGGTLVNNGNNYSVNLNTTTTFYVQSNGGGSTYHVGPTDRGFGNQSNNASTNYGMRFDVIQEATIDSVYLYPFAAGTVTISLRDAANTIINTTTVTVPSTFGIYPVYLGFSVTAGTGYRLIVDAGSVNLYYNTSGAVYPYTTSGCPVYITGYFNPNAGTGVSYYYLYNWVVTSGCKSGFIPVTGVVIGPPVPVITPTGSLLTSSSPTNNQWYFNGNPIPGETGQTYTATQVGSYTVVVTDPITGCVVTSLPYLIVSVFEVSLEQAGVHVFPNPFSEKFNLKFNNGFKGNASLKIMNPLGQLIWEQTLLQPAGNSISIAKNLNSGCYLLQLITEAGAYQSIIIKQ